jgi:hypothetical protein
MIIKFFKNNNFYIFSYIFFIFLTVFIYRSLLQNISTNLLDWKDYPLFVWIMQHNIDHFSALNFRNFFDSNIFYPFQGNILFSDIFLPTSIIGYILHFFTNNPIAIFNLVYFIVLIFNPIACFFFWRNFFTSKWLLFFATLSSSFSPFLIMNYYHFQMLNIWPFFFCLGFFLRKELSIRNAVLGGIFLAIQLWSGVYYAIFAIFIISIWYLIIIWENKNNRIKLIKLLRRSLISLTIFLLLAGILIIKYLQIRNSYGATREYWEYVIYAAHPSDYLFFSYQSLLSEINIFQKWDSFNHHSSSAAFPGFVLAVFSLLGILSFHKINQVRSIVIKLNKQTLFFLILLICGFIFSLGTRLSDNGVYLGIPLPYLLVLKVIPIFEPLRADVRWAFLVSLSLTYFACLGIEKLVKSVKKETTILLFVSFLYLIEIIPINRSTESKTYYDPVYDTIKNLCTLKKTVLLEYPLTQDKKEVDVRTNLSYRTQMLLSSTKHKCNLVNGYSGYIPKDYERYENELFDSVSANDKNLFLNLLKQRDITYLKLNKNEIYQQKAIKIESWLLDSNKYKIIVNNEDYLIVQLL